MSDNKIAGIPYIDLFTDLYCSFTDTSDSDTFYGDGSFKERMNGMVYCGYGHFKQRLNGMVYCE